MKRFYNGDWGRRLLVFFVFGIGIFFYYSFIYQDILITTKHGMNFWSCLTDGKLLQFYSYNKDAVVETSIGTIQSGAYYDFPIYLIFAAWNFPLKVVEKLFAINVFQSLPCLMWMKSILLVFVAGMLWILKKIGILLGVSENDCRVLYALFLSSAFFISAVIIIGQYDIIAVFFMLCGVYYYLRKRYKLFTLFFMIAIPLKLFSLFCFIALILYKEKNWCKIIGNIILALLPMLLLRFVIPFDGISNDILVPMFLLSNNHGIALAPVSAVVIPMVIVYFICWVRQPAQEDIYCKEVIYICFGVYAVLFGCIVAHPYWIIYLAPFVELLIVSKGMKWFKVNIFLETVMAFFYIIAEIFKYPACYSSDIVANMIIAYLSDNVHKTYDGRTILEYEPLFKQISDILNAYDIMNLATGVFVGALIFIAIMLNPHLDLNKYKIIKGENDQRGGMIYFRILAGYCLCLVPIIIYLDLWRHWILQ